MKAFPRQGLFPLFPLITGMIGLFLQYLLLSSADGQGLLPSDPVFGILTFLLLLLTGALCFLNLRGAALSKAYRHLFPPSRIAAAGAALGAVGIGITAFTTEATGFLSILLPITGIAGVGALLYIAYCRLIGLRPSCLLHGCLAVFLIFRLLVYCRVWGAEPQLQLYFFHLLGSVFLLLACYYRAEADALVGDYRKYLFFSQIAVFCCCVCLSGSDWLFYLSAGIWMATDFCVLPTDEEDV